jgi:hypothetical protein
MNFRFQISPKGLSSHRDGADFRLFFSWMFILTTISFAFATAQNTSFTASVDRNRIAMGEQIEITFTLNGSGKNFQPPPFSDFLVLSGPNQSTNMQYINGAMSQSVAYSYVLQPRAEGKFTIGAATIESNGKKIQSNNISIEVTKGSPQQKQQQRQQSAGDANLNKQIGDNLFIKASVNKTSVYQGEQITATYKLYSRVNIVNSSIKKIPALTGFWNQEIDVPKNAQTTEVVNGIQYQVFPIKKIALFPQHSGTLELDPMEAEFVVQVQSRRHSGDIFDQFFGNVQNVNYPTKSSPVKITVRPLPAQNIPAGFSGAVGKFSMESWLDKTETKTNEPVTLKVKISGSGNLKLIEAPKFVFPPDLESYEPKISDNITTGTDIISGSRTYEYLLIPRHVGEQKIPSFTFSYFDPEKQQYVTTKSPDFVLNILKGSEVLNSSTATLSKEEVKLLGQDIRFIKSGTTSFRKKDESFFGSIGFCALLFLPILLFAGFISYIRHYEKITGDIIMLRSRKATKIAKKRLAKAKILLDGKKDEEFYTEISQALWGFAGDRLSIPLSDLSQDSISTALKSRNVNDNSASKFISTLEHCEFARFTPSGSSVQMEKMYNDTIQLISAIEEEVR